MKQEMYHVESEEIVRKEISKLTPLNYNRFRWWRRFDKKKKPLPSNSPLLDKIKNGDLDFSQYWWQAKFQEIELNEAYTRCGYDTQKLLETHAVDLTRRKRLWEDFERDEKEKLMYLRKQFSKEFYMTEEDYEIEVSEFGYSLEKLYIHCSQKYGKKIKIKSKRGRPKTYEQVR